MVRLILTRLLLVAASASVMTGCRIEPPLHLPETRYVEVAAPEVVTDVNIVWEIDESWTADWWYGWNQEDINRWGHIQYTEPSSYDIQFYYYGDSPRNQCLSVDATTCYEMPMRRWFPFGFHDMLIWSNIDSPDATQVLLIDRSNVFDIIATTSPDRLNYSPPAERAAARNNAYNNPEVFYSGMEEDFYVSTDPADYDYYDPERQVWVKNLSTELTPLVYTYLVQIVVYNNNGRILGTADRVGITSMARSVSVHTGRTSAEDVTVTFDMRMKTGLPARDGVIADIIGGKLTTFGLCGMERWQRSRGPAYGGSRPDLVNELMIDFVYSNGSDKVYLFDITGQLQSQCHGGVITIEINADDYPAPPPGESAGGSGFDPTIAPQETEQHEFIL